MCLYKVMKPAHSSKMLHKGALEHLNTEQKYVCRKERTELALGGGSDSGANSYSWAIIRALSFLAVTGRKGLDMAQPEKDLPHKCVALSLIL